MGQVVMDGSQAVLHILCVSVDDADEILVSEGFLGYWGCWLAVPMWYPVRCSYIFMISKAYQSWRSWGGADPSHTWLVGDSRSKLSSSSTSEHFSLVIQTLQSLLQFCPLFLVP